MTNVVIYSSKLNNIDCLDSIHNISLCMYMIIPEFLPLHSYRACLPTYLHSSMRTCVPLQRSKDINSCNHHNKNINMKKNNGSIWTMKDTHYKRIMTLNIRDVNAKCCKQTNSPHPCVHLKSNLYDNVSH